MNLPGSSGPAFALLLELLSVIYGLKMPKQRPVLGFMQTLF